MPRARKTPAVSVTGVGGPTNDARRIIALSEPQTVDFEIEGDRHMLFHRWNVDALEEKARGGKGSKSRKEDDTESYLYRSPDGYIALPTEYVRMSVVKTAKFMSDPRSPRKSMEELAKAAIYSDDEMVVIGKARKTPDYIDRRRCVVQKNGITRHRPAIATPWTARMRFTLSLPEYLNSDTFYELLEKAGKVTGIADFRPTFGRFRIKHFEVVKFA